MSAQQLSPGTWLNQKIRSLANNVQEAPKLTEEKWHDMLEESYEKPIIVNFGADWCGPSRHMKFHVD